MVDCAIDDVIVCVIDNAAVHIIASVISHSIDTAIDLAIAIERRNGAIQQHHSCRSRVSNLAQIKEQLGSYECA